MTSVNTAFKAENGLFVVGDATVTNNMLVNVNMTVTNALVVGTVNSSLIPVSNSFTLGNSTSIYTNLFVDNGTSQGTFNSNTFNVNVANVATSLIPNANAVPLGNTTRRWATYSTLIDASGNATIAGTLGAGNTTVTGFANVTTTLQVAGAALFNNTGSFAGTLGAGNTTVTGFANVTGSLQVGTTASVGGNTTVSGTLGVTGAGTFSNTVGITGATTAANVAITGLFTVTTAGLTTVNSTPSNATFSVLTLQSNNTQVFQNVAFDTDLLVLNAVDNRIGIKNTAPTDLVTIGAGNVAFNTTNSAIRMAGSVATQNAFVGLMSNTANARFTFSMSDSSNSTVLSGGYIFFGVNSTATYSLMSLNNAELTYKSGNVAHAGNFGIYNVSGVRVGP